MFTAFIINAILGGIIVAIIAGILGSFVLWKNMSYFGDSLSHSVLLGVTIGFLLHINLTIAVILFAIFFAILFNNNKLGYSNDTTLGIISYSSLALAVVLASYSKVKIDLMGYLFGDILVINVKDIYYLLGCFVLVLVWIYFYWSKMILFSVSEDLLHSEGGNVKLIKLMFSIILALFIAISFKIVGVLLITAMLIIPSATALTMSSTPFQMVLYSSIIGCISVIGGIVFAINFNSPTGPTIILTSLFCFVSANLIKIAKKSL